jgi:hypothetical protein
MGASEFEAKFREQAKEELKLLVDAIGLKNVTLDKDNTTNRGATFWGSAEIFSREPPECKQCGANGFRFLVYGDGQKRTCMVVFCSNRSHCNERWPDKGQVYRLLVPKNCADQVDFYILNFNVKFEEDEKAIL